MVAIMVASVLNSEVKAQDGFITNQVMNTCYQIATNATALNKLVVFIIFIFLIVTISILAFALIC